MTEIIAGQQIVRREWPRLSIQAAYLVALAGVMTVILLAYGLRVNGLDDFNYNWDEGYSDWIISLPYGEMIQTTARDVHPPLYYMALRASKGLFGAGEFSLRYLSVLLGVLNVAAVFALGKQVGGRHMGYVVGLLAVLLLSLNRANIEISQLMRMHILATVFGTGGLWAALRIWENPRRWGAAVLYVLCIAGALYSFYLAVVLPLATNLAFLVVWGWRWRRGDDWRRLFFTWAGLQIAAALIFLPWALYALGRMHGWNAEEATSFLFFIQVYFVVLVSGVATFWGAYLPWVLLALGVIGAGGYLLYHQPRNRETLALLAVAALTPVLVVFLLILPIHNLGRPLAARYLLLLGAGFYVLAAWGVLAIARRQFIAGGVAAALLIGIATVGMVDTGETRVRQDLLASVGDTLEAHRHPQDGLLLHNDHTWTLFESEYEGDWSGVPYEAQIDAGYANLILEPLWNNHNALWVVKNPGSWVIDADGEIERWLEDRAVASQTWAFDAYTLTLYARTEDRATTLDALAPGYTLPDDLITPPGSAEIGLTGIQQPMRRYPIGDGIHMALWWEDTPGEQISIELSNGTDTHNFTFQTPAANGGPLRQHISLPLTPNIPAGDYAINLTEPAPVHLGSVTLVDLVPELSVELDDIENRLDWQFGEHLQLLGYEINDTNFRPGDEVEVTLYWQTDEVIDERYKILVYTLGEWNDQTDTPLWGVHDTEPRDWTFPTTQWPPETMIGDKKTYDILDYTPPGEYQIGVVVYGLLDNERLTITDAAGNVIGDMATLTPVTVR